MCNAASFIVTREYKVYFHPTQDSHMRIIDQNGLHEGSGRNREVNLVPVEICPPKGKLTLPFDQWKFTTDLHEVPSWYDAEKAERAVRLELPKWAKKLEGISLSEVYKPINPLKIKAKRLNKKHKLALKEWDSMRNDNGGFGWVWRTMSGTVQNSVGEAVFESVWGSIIDSVEEPISNSIAESLRNEYHRKGEPISDSIWESIGDSVEGSIQGYCSSLFPNIKSWWTVYEKPWGSISLLWRDGYVPSFDGKVWRLHRGKRAKIVFEITPKELKKIT